MVRYQMFFVTINVLLIWALPVTSEYYSSHASQERILLNDGNLIPAVAFGTATDTIPDLVKIPQAVIWAIEAGYRHIDTAALYINEDLIGQALINVTCRGIVKREDIFITTKLIVSANTREKVVPALIQALRRLQVDYVDLFLIHTPYNPLRFKHYDILDIWNGMEDAKNLGLTKSIGVSNFDIKHLHMLLSYSTIPPAVNEIEVNPTHTNLELVEYCQRNGIVVMSYSPLGLTVPRPRVTYPPPPSLNDPVLVNIAQKHGVTTNQVVLRYLIDRRTIPTPRSTKKEHIYSNIDILNFSLTAQEMRRISEYNLNLKTYGYTDLGFNVFIGSQFKIRMDYVHHKNRTLYPH